MLIVLPFCPSDQWLVEKSLEWCKTLDGSYDYECLLSYERGMDVAKVKELCGGLFKAVHELVRNPCSLKGWPYPQNKCFQDTARHIKKNFPDCSFFWWEADCTPLKPGWLNAIQEAYNEGGKPFGGSIVKLPNGGHLNGVAVYPADVGKWSTLAMLAHHEPWDRLMKKDCGINTNVTDLDGVMQHLWVDPVNEQCPTFPDWETVERLVKPDAFVFHRCKDGSLLQRLQEPKKTFLGGLVSKLMSKSEHKHCVLCYLPPKGIGHTDVFLEHMADFPPDCPVMYITDGDWPKSEKIPAPPSHKSDKIATFVFLHGLALVRKKGFTHFIYIETDCRFARKGWDAEFLKGIGEGIIGAGNLAVCNMDKSDKAFKNEFHRLNGRHPFMDKPGGLKHSTILGQRWNNNEPLPFTNGAPSIYSVKELDDLFGSRGIQELVDIMPNQDGAIGEFALKKYGAVEALKKWKHLPTVMATAGERVYTVLDRMAALKNGCVAVHPFKSRWKPATKDGYSYYSSGDFGDIIYQIKTIQLMGGGRLILGHENTCKYRARSPITKAGFDLIQPLLAQQKYLTGIEFSEKQKPCSYNFNNFREFWNVKNTDQPSTLVEINAWFCGVFPLFNCEPWLTVNGVKKIAPIVIHRSARYHSKDFDWKNVLSQRSRPEFCFVGLPEEHKEFVKEFGMVPFYQAADFEDLAKVINGCDVFVGNQSFPNAIALALGKKVFQEVYATSPDCVIPNRPNLFTQHNPLEKI